MVRKFLNNINLIRLSTPYLLIILLFFSCNKKSTEAFCRISFAVETDTFYQGCTIPISVYAGGETNGELHVQLFINGESKGFISTAPYKYYWNTEDVPTGDQTIKAIYTSSENIAITDEQIINLLPVSTQCQGEVFDIDGNSYPVVQIGNQCWMQENLKTTHYADGEALINGIDSLVGWLPNELPGWYFAFNRDISSVDTYGYLYTWTTAMKGSKAANGGSILIQGICPDGWHMPSVEDWRELIDYAGGIEIAANKLKDSGTLFWNDNAANTDNASGFTALPGGCRIFDGSYLDIRLRSYFWTATETIPNHAYHIYLNNYDSRAFILGEQDSKRFGYSVRCVKD